MSAEYFVDYDILRSCMIYEQLVRRGIKDPLVIQAMKKVLRHEFFPLESRKMAYEDMAYPIGEGQTISQPYMVALMSEVAELSGEDKVLEIGTGTGYQTAVLAELAKEVFTVERIKILAEKAEKKLSSLGYKNIHIVVADGSKGLPSEAPFDVIMVTASAPEVPDILLTQLKDGGRLIIPVGERYSQYLNKIVRNKDRFVAAVVTKCVFVPLIGEFGWDSEDRDI